MAVVSSSVLEMGKIKASLSFVQPGASLAFTNLDLATLIYSAGSNQFGFFPLDFLSWIFPAGFLPVSFNQLDMAS